MIKSFTKTFGVPNDVILGIGDWEQKKHRKFKEPVKGKGLPTMFRKHGFIVLLVDEFRTSKMCSFCSDEDGVCEKFRWIDNPRPYRIGKLLYHGLFKCNTCSRLWNRDVNGACNIWKMAQCAINRVERPLYLQRRRA